MIGAGSRLLWRITTLLCHIGYVTYPDSTFQDYQIILVTCYRHTSSRSHEPSNITRVSRTSNNGIICRCHKNQITLHMSRMNWVVRWIDTLFTYWTVSLLSQSHLMSPWLPAFVYLSVKLSGSGLNKSICLTQVTYAFETCSNDRYF